MRTGLIVFICLFWIGVIAQVPPRVMDELLARASLPVESTTSFTYYATELDGTNDYLTANIQSSWTESDKGILSFWIRCNGGDATLMQIFQSKYGRFDIIRWNNNFLQLIGYNAAGTKVLQIRTSGAELNTSSGWVCVMVSWDLSVPTNHVYYGDSAQSRTITVQTSGNIAIPYNPVRIGSDTDANYKLNADLCEFYINNTNYLDFSIESNRRKFYSASGKPVNLGSDGSTPTGGPAWIYLKNPYTSFNTNAGTAGNFTVVGTLTESPTTP